MLEYCPHIRVEVKAVTSNGKVSIEDIPPRDPNVDATLYIDEERPDGDPLSVPPLGIETWATKDESPSVADLQRLLRHGWDLRQTR